MNNRSDNDGSMLEEIISMYGFDLPFCDIKKNIVKAERVKISSVYFLWKDKQIVYVGCTTTHPMERMLAHKSGADFDEISWIEVPKELLRAVEWFYINKLDPPKNRNRYKPWLGPDVEDFTGISIAMLNGQEAEKCS